MMVNRYRTLNNNRNNNINNLPRLQQESLMQLEETNKTKVQVYLTNCKSFYSCIYCRTHLADHDELVSRSFQGSHGRAYLFNSVINMECGDAVTRELNTGVHAVADIHCANCQTTLGWKYEKAYVETQKYKEGKFIIELAHVVRENRHLEMDQGELVLLGRRGNSSLRNQAKYSNSLSPPSMSELSSPSSSSNEEVGDDELMFPFYDEIISESRLSCPSTLSHCHHNRMRRSLYLDSTPYDWKYSTSKSCEDDDNDVASPPLPPTGTDGSCSNSSAQTQPHQVSLASSSVSSTSCSSEASSSLSGVHYGQEEASYHSNADNKSRKERQQNSECSSKDLGTFESDTQFKFEVDNNRSEFSYDCGSSASCELNNKQCDQAKSCNIRNTLQIDNQTPSTSYSQTSRDKDDNMSSNSNETSSSSSSSGDTTARSRVEEASHSNTNDNNVCDVDAGVVVVVSDLNRNNSYEQFYDCFTDNSNYVNSN